MKRYRIIVQQGMEILRSASVLDETVAREEHVFRIKAHTDSGWKIAGVDGGTTLLKKGRACRTVLFVTEDL